MGRQLGDPSGEAALAPLKGELLSNAKLRGFLVQLSNKPLRLTFVRHLPFQGRQGHVVPVGFQDGDTYNIIYKLFTRAIVVK